MASERMQTAELQARLSSSVQEKLAAEGKQERLELEIQRLVKQLQWHQDQLSTTKEVLGSSQKPELHIAHFEPRVSPVKNRREECLAQVTALVPLGGLG